MKFYAIFAAIFVAIATLLNVFVCIPVDGMSPLAAALFEVGAVAAIVFIDLATIFLVYACPGKFFLPNKAPFKTGKGDRKLLDVISFERIEGKMMRDTALFSLFNKEKPKKGTDATSLLKEMVVTGKTEASRYAIIVLSLLVLLIFPKKIFLLVSLSLVLCNLILAVLSVLTARFDRMELQKEYKKLLK